MLPIFITLCLCLNPAISKDMKDMNLQELVTLAEDISQIRPNDVQLTDIKFYLFTRNLSGIQLEYFIGNNSILDPIKETKILLHGWLENHQRNWYQKLTNEYLIKGDFNIIQVDWERVARSSYVSSAENAKLVGEHVGRFILNHNLSTDQMHLIGHSLGAHIAGFAAKKIQNELNGKRIKRITGLDPAGPYFREFFITQRDRLDLNDANIVDILHTDGGFYGYEKAIGTLDIYINGGKRIQPGCLDNFKISPSFGELIEDTFCSHSKSCLYFIDIINHGKFTCTKCDSLENYQKGLCNNNEKYVIGAEDINEKTTGKCFVTTKRIKPPLNLENVLNFIPTIN